MSRVPGVCVPNAFGAFPIHLAFVGRRCDRDNDYDDKQNRVDCICLLLNDTVVPLTVLGRSKQTVLHAMGEDEKWLFFFL